MNIASCCSESPAASLSASDVYRTDRVVVRVKDRKREVGVQVEEKLKNLEAIESMRVLANSSVFGSEHCPAYERRSNAYCMSSG